MNRLFFNCKETIRYSKHIALLFNLYRNAQSWDSKHRSATTGNHWQVKWLMLIISYWEYITFLLLDPPKYHRLLLQRLFCQHLQGLNWSGCFGDTNMTQSYTVGFNTVTDWCGSVLVFWNCTWSLSICELCFHFLFVSYCETTVCKKSEMICVVVCTMTVRSTHWFYIAQPHCSGTAGLYNLKTPCGLLYFQNTLCASSRLQQSVECKFKNLHHSLD